jgi:hypothetical protein
VSAACRYRPTPAELGEYCDSAPAPSRASLVWRLVQFLAAEQLRDIEEHAAWLRQLKVADRLELRAAMDRADRRRLRGIETLAERRT